jgi:hypothetical protein
MTEANEFDDDQDVLDDESEEDDYEPAFEVSCKPSTRSGGANFRTMRLTFPRPDQAVVIRTLGASLFAGVFMLAGVAVGIMGIFYCFQELTSANMIIPQIFFLGFGGAGYWMWRSGRPIAFDKTANCFWRNKRRGRDGQDNGVSLEKIECLQVLCKYQSGDGGGYHSYELNIVLNDPPGERFRIMNHGKSDLFWQDAYDLAEFLDKPIWDCTDSY